MKNCLNQESGESQLRPMPFWKFRRQLWTRIGEAESQTHTPGVTVDGMHRQTVPPLAIDFLIHSTSLETGSPVGQGIVELLHRLQLVSSSILHKDR